MYSVSWPRPFLRQLRACSLRDVSYSPTKLFFSEVDKLRLFCAKLCDEEKKKHIVYQRIVVIPDLCLVE